MRQKGNETAGRPADNLPLAETICLADCQGRRGILTDIIEPDGEEIVLARVAGELVELPGQLSAQLWGLLGQRVVVARVGDCYQVGHCSPVGPDMLSF
jgi:hypothetical protein